MKPLIKWNYHTTSERGNKPRPKRIVQFYEEVTKNQIKALVRGSVEKRLNKLPKKKPEQSK